MIYLSMKPHARVLCMFTVVEEEACCSTVADSFPFNPSPVPYKTDGQSNLSFNKQDFLQTQVDFYVSLILTDQDPKPLLCLRRFPLYVLEKEPEPTITHEG